MNFFVKCLLTAGLVAVFAAGCGDDDDSDRTPNDTSSEMDGGTGNDTSDTGTGVSGATLTANAENWIDGTTNPWGIQGSWFPYDDNNSCDETDPSICGTSTITMTPSGNGGMCASGTATKVQNSLYGVFWGAGIGFNLCQDAPGGTENNIGACTIADLSAITGFRMTITGSLPEGGGELRIMMSETSSLRKESTYIVADTLDAPVDYLFSEAKVGYAPSEPGVNPAQVQSIQLQVSTVTSGDTTFNFCVDNIEPVFYEISDTDSSVTP